MKKRLLSTLLALWMTLALLPAQSLAMEMDSDSTAPLPPVVEDGKPEVPEEFQLTEGSLDEHVGPEAPEKTDAGPTLYADTVAYPVTGGNLSFNLTTGTIVRCDESVTSAVIPSNIDGVAVTSIGADAFYDCSRLTSVSIPNSVISIGQYAFRGCCGLTSITVPGSVARIEWGAFCDCSSLTSIKISDGVTTIGIHAFSGCSRLSSVTIPNSVTSIGDAAFDGCSELTKIEVSAANIAYSDIDGVLFDKRRETLIIFPAHRQGYYDIPSSVTSIVGYAFSGCSRLTSVTIPNGVTSIGFGVFQDCSSLTSIALPSGITSIAERAFSNCSSLTSITLPSNITSIAERAFYNCSSLTSIAIPSSVTNVGYGAFEGCSNLTSIIIPNGVTSIEWSTFRGCSNLTNITIPNGVTAIGDFAFDGCSCLVDITIPDGVTSIGDAAFQTCSGLMSITIPSSVTSIESSAFYGCSNLTRVTILDGVTSLGRAAFYNCSSLTSIAIPGSVTSIGRSAFVLCSNLKDIYYSGTEMDWAAISIDAYNETLNNATIHYNNADRREGFRISANTATTCLKKGTTFEMNVAYFWDDAIDLSAKEFVAVSSSSDVLDFTAGGWNDKTGRRYTVTAKQAGSSSITFTNPQTGTTNKIDFIVIDGETGYTFDSVPKITIEKDKTTNFYNFSGLVVDDFAYTPHIGTSGNIDYYTVTMSVYNTKNLYGTVTSYDANGEIYEFAVIDKHSDYSTSFVGDLKELKNSIGDLFYLLGNNQYYSGESISKKTSIHIKVPTDGYLQISNSLSSEAAAVINVVGLLVDGTVRVSDLVSSSSGKPVDENAELVDAIVKEAFSSDFAKKQLTGELKKTVQKSFKTGTWNLNNYGECLGTFLEASSELGIDLAKNIANKVCDAYGVLSVTESVVKKVIPTGNLINFLYSTLGIMDESLFWVNFQASANFPSGIFIYAPASGNSYQSNGVSVTPAVQKESNVVVHAYRVVDTADISGSKYETYSINMYRDGQKTQPDAPVSVQIPLPESYNKGAIKVYRMNDDGTVSNMNAQIIGGYAVFSTDHFSYYALVDGDANGVFLSRWTSGVNAIINLSDPDGVLDDAIFYAASYDSTGKMTDIVFGSKTEPNPGEIQIAFSNPLGQDWELYVLDADYTPVCLSLTLPEP